MYSRKNTTWPIKYQQHPAQCFIFCFQIHHQICQKMQQKHSPVLPCTYFSLPFQIRKRKEPKISIGINGHQQYHKIFGYFHDQICHRLFYSPSEMSSCKIFYWFCHEPSLFKRSSKSFQYLFRLLFSFSCKGKTQGSQVQLFHCFLTSKQR